MIKSILLVLLGLFFVLNGANHLFNTYTYQEYAEKRGLVSPRLMVRVSGVLLVLGGATLILRRWMLYGIIGLSVFLVVASFTMHRFWTERETEMKMLEGMHFAKNFAILTELIYIATTT